MITGKNNHGVFPLTGLIKGFQNSSELIINLCDHRIVPCLSKFGIMFFGCTNFILEITLCQLSLCLEIAFLKMWAGHVLSTELVGIGLGGNEGRVRVVNIYIEHPWLLPFFSNELNASFGCPGGLMKFSGYTVFALP